LEGEKARPLLGLKIGDTIDGTAMGLSGQLMLMGGSDRSGFPMVRGVHGAVKAGLLVGKGHRRRRATVRGEIVSEDIYQLNLVRVMQVKDDDVRVGKEGQRDEGGRSQVEKRAQEEGAKGKAEEKE